MSAEEMLKEIKRILKDETPLAGAISKVELEGPFIALYCKDFNAFVEDGNLVKDLARRLRKRIILRPDPELLTDPKVAEEEIRKVVPPEAEISRITFNEELGEVIIEAAKPGMVVGKEGIFFREILGRTHWAPRVVRTPPLRSAFVESLRQSLLTNLSDRRNILKKVGRRIYREKLGKQDWTRLTFLGGAREVGRSAIMLQTPESRVLLDCGVNVASDERAYPHLEIPEASLSQVDAVVLSHAHLDHSGFVMTLYKYGYEGPVYCTPPTRDLVLLLAADYLKVSEEQGKTPPFGREEMKAFMKHCITLDYENVTDISPDIKMTFHNAGHILGSCVTHFHIGGGLHNLVYTGDMKFMKTRMFWPAVRIFPRVETLLLESTYGGPEDVHPPREQAEAELIQTINATFQRGGKVIIPAFAVGRSQEIMIVLADAHKRGLFEGTVYLDGMILEATAIHALYPEYLCSEMRELILTKDENPFLSPIFKRVDTPDERKAVIESPEPCVIITTSGMMTGGPVIEYFKELAQDPRNCLIFVGYQAEGSLGNRIQQGCQEIALPEPGGKTRVVKVMLEVKTIEGFSGHSDRNQLINYVRRMSPTPSRVICCHGEEKKCLSLASALHKILSVETRVPLNLETIRLR
ncbi:MAG: beta-CASP ribonuclease aCPSF1 [Candidatus Hadarchaeales archaeon]